MNKIILSLILFSSIYSYGQIKNDEELIGKWSVVHVVDKHFDPRLKPVVKGFQTASFEFDSTRTFNLSSKNRSNMFNIFIDMTLGTKWKFDPIDMYIKIGTEADKYSVMGIFISYENEKIYFTIEESEIKMEVKKKE